MTLPSNITKNHLDQSSDDPKQARAELVAAIDAINALINHLGLSVVTTSPMGLGSNLYNNNGNIDVRSASVTQKGVAELATDAEAIAKSDALRSLTPKNLAAIQASTSMSGLIEIATNQETINGSDASLAVSPVGLKTALESYGDKDVQVFTASGIWTKPAGISRVRVLLVGAGGSGAGTGGNCGARSGGAGGGFAEAVIDVSSLSSVAITVGAGGPAEVDTTCATGTDGGDSSFGSFVTAHGGQGGFNGTAQGGTVTHSSSSSIIAVTGRKGGSASIDNSGPQMKFGAASGWNDNELWQNYNGDGDNFGAWRDDGRDAVHVGSGGTAGSNYYYHERTTGAGADGVVIVEPIG